MKPTISTWRELIVGTLLVSLSAVAARAEEVNVTFLLISDIYDMEGSGDRGGFSRAAAVARSEKFFNANLLYIHAGDTLSPSLMSSLDKGDHVIELLNVYPPDVFVPGNHEYDFGPDVFKRLILERLKSEVFGANIRDAQGDRIDSITDARIYDFDGVKIGLFGLISPTATELSSPGDRYLFLPLLETARTTAAALRENGADIVVLVSHSSFAEDEMLMNDAAIDVLLSGDDHDLKIEYNGKVAMAETRSEADYIVAVDLRIDVSERDGKRRVRWWPNFRIIDTIDYDPDPETQRLTEIYLSQLEDELDRDIGATATALDTRRDSVRGMENAFGNLVADVIRDFVKADVGFTNGGGIRANREYPVNTILTRRDILSELPFGNSVVKLQMQGSVLLAALENGVSQVENGAGRFAHVSGISMNVDLNKEPGSRVSGVMINGTPIDLDATYTVATNDYMAGGGDGYSMFAESSSTLLDADDTDLVASAVIEHIVDKGSVAPAIEGRINF